MDLVCDPVTGKLKETLLWSNLGKGGALLWFNWKCYQNTDTENLWIIVLVVLTCHAAFSQFVMTRLGVTTTSSSTTEVTVKKAKPC